MSEADQIRRQATVAVDLVRTRIAAELIERLMAEMPEDRAAVLSRINQVFCDTCGTQRQGGYCPQHPER